MEQQQGECVVATEAVFKRRHVHKFGGSSLAELVLFMKNLESLARQVDCKLTVALSYSPAELPEELKPYARV